GAADEEVAIGWRVERLGRVGNRSRYQAAFARVTDPSPAGPTNWHVARLGELEQALIRRGLPTRCDPAARERDQRARAGLADRQMRRPLRSGHQAWRARFTAQEELPVDPI